MQNDYFTQKREKIATSLIRQWKSDEAAIMAEYGSRENFFEQAEAAELWRDAKIRDEFQGNKENLKSFLENESRAKEHKGGLSSHKKPENLDNDVSGADDAIKIKWDADPSLRKEFENDYQGYLAWAQNRHRVKTM